jgi:hypothetical protein
MLWSPLPKHVLYSEHCVTFATLIPCQYGGVIIRFPIGTSRGGGGQKHLINFVERRQLVNLFFFSPLIARFSSTAKTLHFCQISCAPSPPPKHIKNFFSIERVENVCQSVVTIRQLEKTEIFRQANKSNCNPVREQCNRRKAISRMAAVQK